MVEYMARRLGKMEQMAVLVDWVVVAAVAQLELG
jgi:hypothetical protein